jgi:1-deoxy-D-xylulose-5-phosphate synthase
LLEFARRFPDRFFDVGIAEQHAVTFAAGLAMSGLRPVVCIYSTFLQRAFDQVGCDAALHGAPVLFVLDRAGVTGDDGASHHGMLDLAYLRVVPGMTVSAPSDPDELRRLLATGLAFDGPFSIRYPRGAAPAGGDAPLEPVEVGRSRVLRSGTDVVLVGVGKMVGACVQAAELLAAQGLGITVVDARFVKPIDAALPELCARHQAVVTVEDGTLRGGFGAGLLELLAAADVHVPVRTLGLPDRYLEHGAQAGLLAGFGLDAPGIAAVARELVPVPPRSALAG